MVLSWLAMVGEVNFPSNEADVIQKSTLANWLSLFQHEKAICKKLTWYNY